MQRKIIKVVLTALIMVGFSTVWGMAVLPVSARPPGETTNLLANPSFEQPFILHERPDGGGFVAEGWQPWWYNDAGAEYDGPEFKQANILQDPNRVRSGEDAQQYFRPWVKHLAGIYQQAQVPANSKLKFTIYGHAWSTFCEGPPENLSCDPRNSYHGAVNPIAMKIGIDPTGGTDPYSDAIVWSAARGVYDNYELFSVEATAQGDKVTVYTYSTPEWPSAVINVYWDDAALVVVGEGEQPKPTQPPAPTAPPGGNPPSGGGSGAIVTQAPSADGSVWHIVQSGDTLFGIAFAYGVDIQVIRGLNNLQTDMIFIGQKLLIRPAPSEPTPTPPPAETEATQPPAEVAEQPPAATTGRICLTLFDDQNENGLWETTEPLLAGGTLVLSGVTAATHVTDGVSEPFCFADLGPGDYTVSVVPPAGYHVTGLQQIPITLSGGGDVPLSFGAAVGEMAAQPGDESSTGGGAGNGPRIGVVVTIIAVVGLLLVAGGGGVIAYFLIYRRRTGIS